MRSARTAARSSSPIRSRPSRSTCRSTPRRGRAVRREDGAGPYVELGDALDYEVKVANRADIPLDSVVVVRDRLPTGFAYVHGSARENGVALADPRAAAGRADVRARHVRRRPAAHDPLPPGASAPGLDGDGVNRAWAARGTLVSNVASARVRLESGVFARDATVLGTVFVDMDGDGRPGPAIPGCRACGCTSTTARSPSPTPKGATACTASRRARTRSRSTRTRCLPARVRSRATREGRSNGIAFVDPSNGELYRADWRVPAIPRSRTSRARRGARRAVVEVDRARDRARRRAARSAPRRARRPLAAGEARS